MLTREADGLLGYCEWAAPHPIEIEDAATSIHISIAEVELAATELELHGLLVRRDDYLFLTSPILARVLAEREAGRRI